MGKRFSELNPKKIKPRKIKKYLCIIKVILIHNKNNLLYFLLGELNER